jgi:transposase
MVNKPGDVPHKSVAPERLLLDFGDGYLLYKFTKKLNVYQIIGDIFNNRSSSSLFSLIYYRMCMQSAMYNAEEWLNGNVVKLIFKDANLGSQYISRLLKRLGDETIQRRFFTNYLALVKKPDQSILIDATALPNNSNIGFNAWGHNDIGMDKQLRMLCVADQESGMPLFYRAIPGNILDISTLKNTLTELDELKLKCSLVLLDAGYFSKNNTDELYRQNINFLTRMQKSRTIYKDIICSEIKGLECPKFAVFSGKRGLFVKRIKIELFEHNAFAYLVLDPIRKGKELQDLFVESSQSEVLDINQYDIDCCGTVIFVSSIEIDSTQVVSYYYTRMQIEQVFSFCKSDLQILPLRKHCEQTMSGYLFLQFLMLIIFVHLRKVVMDKFTVEQVLLTMRNLKCKTYNGSLIVAEFTKKQKDIFKLCGLEIPAKSKITALDLR